MTRVLVPPQKPKTPTIPTSQGDIGVVGDFGQETVETIDTSVNREPTSTLDTYITDPVHVVVGCLPRNDKEVKRCLFNLARGFKHDLHMDLEDSKPFVLEWRTITQKERGVDMPNLRKLIEEFEVNWGDAKHPLSPMQVLQQAYEWAKDETHEVPFQYTDSQRERLMYLFCKKLAIEGHGTFMCPRNKVAKIFNTHPNLIDGCLKDMEFNKHIRTVKSGTAHKLGVRGQPTLYAWQGPE